MEDLKRMCGDFANSSIEMLSKGVKKVETAPREGSTTKDEKKWDTRELEVLAIIVTLEQFNYLIEGMPITVQTDHKNLKWLMSMKEPGGRLGRWVLGLADGQWDDGALFRRDILEQSSQLLERVRLQCLETSIQIAISEGESSSVRDASRRVMSCSSMCASESVSRNGPPAASVRKNTSSTRSPSV